MQEMKEQFHIRCVEGDVGRYCLLPGDPGRCEAIAAHFDKGTVQGRLLKDDASAAQWLDYFTLAQITEFINLVTEKGDCPNSAAALLEYKNAKYPDADPFAEFVLDL